MRRLEPACEIGVGCAKLRLEALGHRLQGREAIADHDRVDRDAESLVVIDRREHPTQPSSMVSMSAPLQISACF
jgi:hypothetical protein